MKRGLRNFLRFFIRDEHGATTVEWVVLSAAVIGLGMVVLLPIALNTDSATQGVAEYIQAVPIGISSN